MTIHQIPNTASLDAFWMPFTANRQFKAEPRLIASAEGMHYTTVDGRKVIDGIGRACGASMPVTAGARSRMRLSASSRRSTMRRHSRSAIRSRSISPRSWRRSRRAGLDRIFFTNSGSESVDTALKIALAYHRAAGQATRTRLIGRERGYHGVGFGGMSVGGMVNNRRAFAPHLPGVDHLRHTHDLARNAFSRGQPAHGAELADDVERLVALHGADTIAAVIVEPVAGSTGVLIPPQGYLQRLRALCDKHGILLIFDEVITGFGRLGAPFATNYFGVTPDLITTAKGITNGVVPMGAVFASRKVHDALMTGPASQIELFHGYTYSAHPVACAAGLATLEIYQKEGLLTRGAELTEYWQDAMHSLRVLAERDRYPRHRPGRRRRAVVAAGCGGRTRLRRHGRLLQSRPRASQLRRFLALSPPLIVERSHIDDIVAMLGDALKRAA